MVAVDEQYPYRLYMPQQDNSTLIIPSIPPVSWGFEHPAQAWSQASGCETGQIWPKKNGLVVWGACKGEVGRFNTVTGQEKHYWVYPQNRYGHDPDEIKYRFPRQTVVYVSPHDERVIYQASHVLHRSMDEGISWDIISPDLTAKEPQYQIVSGNPITRDVTGEEVYSTIYSMIESRLERGVIWIGANDGPVSVTRDNGKTWKNVTPKDLVGARIQTVEDSPHMKGRAYIAGYRFMREHDLKPYIYRTDNYGESWTLLTDGKNGIPIDHPTRVVREDPRQAGLLYAGTEFGFFVSFNGGKNWQSLQQNLPATPITDIKVHRNDLVISTMGRSAYIMDNVTPLQQLAALANAAPGATGGHDGGASVRGRLQPDRTGRAARRRPVPAARSDPLPQRHGGRVARRAGIPDDRRAVRPLLRQRARRRDQARSARCEGRRAQDLERAGAAQRRRAGAGDARTVPRRRWRLGRHSRRGRHAAHHVGPALPRSVDARTQPEGGFGGPMVPPGKYSVRLTAGGQTITRTFDLKSDPRVAADGVTDGDHRRAGRSSSCRCATPSATRASCSSASSRRCRRPARSPASRPACPASRRATPSTTTSCRRSTRKVVTTPGIYTQGDADRSAEQRAADDHAGRSEGRQGRLRPLRGPR